MKNEIVVSEMTEGRFWLLVIAGCTVFALGLGIPISRHQHSLNEESRPTKEKKFDKGDIVLSKSSKEKGQVIKVFWYTEDRIPEWVYDVRFLTSTLKDVEMREFEMEKP